MNLLLGIVLGVVLALLVRVLFHRLLLVKLRRDVAALAAGDHRPLLSGYADDAVLVFTEGDHRWSGTYTGREAIGGFLADFVRCGITGEVLELWTRGWPWSLSILVRFDDGALDEEGRQVYENRTVLLCRTRWGKIVRQEDYYFDTTRMVDFDRNLTARGL